MTRHEYEVTQVETLTATFLVDAASAIEARQYIEGMGPAYEGAVDWQDFCADSYPQAEFVAEVTVRRTVRPARRARADA